MRFESLLELAPTRNILVVGDVMLDEYLWGHVRGISQEAPVPIVEIRHQSYAPGGAGNVAANLVSLGSNVVLTGVVGIDAQAARIHELFSHTKRVSMHLFPCPDRPTTVKTRILAHSQQMIRADREERHAIAPEAETSILTYVRQRLDRLHACILSDYAKGVLTEKLLQSIITVFSEANIPIIVDPKGARYSRYRGATVITPNTAEANLAANNSDESMSLEQVADHLSGEFGDGALLITRGPEGMSLFRHGAPPVHIPTQAQHIYDVTGAGDTVVAVLALLLAAGEDLEHAARIANYAAGVVVGKIGTASLSLEELRGAFV